MLDKVLTGERTFHSLTPCDLSNTNKSEIIAYFENTYDLNESLYTSLADESVMYKCPDRLRLPLIFYYGHTACVYINKLILAELIQPHRRINLKFETLFETGVDEMSWDDTENYRMGGQYEWPALDDVIEYRRQVRHLILDVIEKTPLELPITMDSPWWALFMGMEHERIHLETSSVLIRQLPVAMVTKPDGFVYGPIKGPEAIADNPMLPVSTQDITLGKPRNVPSYGWDNEYGQRDCRIPAFSASKYMITNREFREFVEADGYNKSEFWTDEGWKWKEFCQAYHPVFWVCDKGCKSRCGANIGSYSHCHQGNDDVTYLRESVGNSNGCRNAGGDTCHQGSDEGGGQTYRLRCMFDVLSMPCDWPVEVTYHEAKAYCRWKGPGYRLPSEAEHNAIREKEGEYMDCADCDIRYKRLVSYNVNLQYGSSTPVNLYRPTRKGFHDVMGNVWEWTEDHLNGLPGFSTSYLYDDFSAPCFDGRHNIIMGGSWISTGCEASRFSRFAFRRHFAQHCGFRLVKSSQPKTLKSPICIISTPVYEDNVVAIPDLKRLSFDDGVTEPEASLYVGYVLDNNEMLLQQMRLEASDNTFTRGVLTRVEKSSGECSGTRRRWLHLGCGVGNLSFKLFELCDELIGTDTSRLLVDYCIKLQSKKTRTFSDQDEITQVTESLPTRTNNITFKHFTWLPNEVEYFDLVVSTFFDRVQNVSAWTSRLREVIKDQGLLVVTSTDRWTEDELTPLMSTHFRLLEASDVLLNNGAINRMTTWLRI